MRSLVRPWRALCAVLLFVSLLAPFQFASAQIVRKKIARSGKLLAPVRAAATGKVALYAADPPGYVADVQSKLTATRLFTQVDPFALAGGCGGTAAQPTLAQLQQYDAVLIWSDCSFPDAAAMGDVLADYLDAGGGVVLASRAFDSSVTPTGRLRTGNYLPLSPGGTVSFSREQTLVKVLPSHPILEGVNSFDGGTNSLHNSAPLASGAEQVARWSFDGYPLVATKQPTAGRIIALNMYPPSSDVDSSYWVSTTDGARLMANALLFAGKQLAPSATPAAGQLIISEFRLSGSNGASDEFVELYNASGAPLMVQSADGSAGLALAASDGSTRFSVPNSTFIPAGGHFLGCPDIGPSLRGYPAGSGTTATCDAVYSSTNNIPDNAGIAIFNNATGGASFSPANRLDAVGSTSEANTLYKEGAGSTPLAATNSESSFVRDLSSGVPKDTDDNAADFVLVATDPSSVTGSRLGAPGPENTQSPVQRNATIKASLIDPGCTTTSVGLNANPVGGTCPRVRDLTSATNAPQGTLSIRRTFTNNTGSPITQLRFRVVNITTAPAPAGTADLRALTSSDVSAICVGTGAGCPSPGATVAIRGLKLEQPPTQSNGGGLNSTLSAGTITLNSPLAPGATINVQFLLGVAQGGSFRFFVNVEALL